MQNIMNEAPKTTKEVTKKVKVESYDISRSDETLDLAKDLAKFIKDNKLTTNVQGKEFVNVEGWQYAGSRLGIVPIVDHVINVSTEGELKYQAKVTLFDLRSQHTVGAGFAVCSNKESGKKFYQEFAIMSMAQTRAIGKAYRNCLAWIIRAAGYEPTPAEEMENNPESPALPAPVPVAIPAATTSSAAAKPLPPAQINQARNRREVDYMLLLNNECFTQENRADRLPKMKQWSDEQLEKQIAKTKEYIRKQNEANPADGYAHPTEAAAL